jgi:hypothetical protein
LLRWTEDRRAIFAVAGLMIRAVSAASDGAA